MDAVRLVGRAAHDAPQEGDLVAALLDRHAVILDLIVLEVRELMIVRREERLGVDLLLDVLDDGARDAHAVERARAAANLIEDDKAVLRRVLKDLRDFIHLDHEGALTADEVVARADALSTSERRPLAQMPELSASSYLSGKFMSGYEDYATDQFPLREQFRTLKALMGLYVFGQKDNNGVYLADGSAAKLEYPLNEGSVAHAADRFRYLYETLMAGTNAKVYLSVIPDKNYFLAEANGYPALDYQALTDALRKQTEFAAYIDLFGTLTADDYYRTDSHWRQENLLTAADTLAAAMGVALPDNRYTEWTLDRPYYGVYYGYAALPMEPDHLTYLTSDLLDACTVYNYETGKTGPIYDLAKGAGKDPYELFLSGSVSLLTIENPNADTDRELVIFRDSFGSSLAPLLVPGYAKVTLADIRYLPSSQMGKYLTFTDQDVLFLYSAPVLNNSETLK